MKIALVDQIVVIAKMSSFSLSLFQAFMYIALFIFQKKTPKALLYTINEQAKSLSRFPACLTGGDVREQGISGVVLDLRLRLRLRLVLTGEHYYKHRRPTETARTVLYRLLAELVSGVERTVTWRSLLSHY